ncbi:MAG: NAD(P)/FAD-dependent oxidoreductase [Gemmatimonadetes bacterium]|nr:NAD(P)/FAD-dependent oxidoreductase [Gemmatimonadota bacterium]
MKPRATDVDVAVVGAGHNALVAAAYLAQAGYSVAVFERRHVVGGAVATEEIVPGYRFDIGGSAHILIRLTPVVEELGLEAHGLEYLELDPLFFAPFEDDDHLFIHRDLERTVEHLETRLPGEGRAYRAFVDEWRPFAHMVRDAFLSAPGPLDLAKHFVFTRGMRSEWSKALPRILRPYGTVLDEYFREERLKAPLVWMAAQSGPPPSEPVSAPFVLWQPLYHEGGIARPRGGSGVLTQALARAIEAHGGTVHTSTPVERIRVEGGRAVAVEVDGGRTVTARAVLSGAHVLETFGRLLPEEHVPDAVKGLRVGNGFGLIVRLALDGPVRYRAHPGPEARIALQLLCRDRAQIDAAYADFLRGEPARDPPLVAMSFSAVDDSLAPPGGEVLWLWAQYFPYALRGASWDDIGERVGDGVVDAFERYAPGTRDRIVGRLVQHPLWLERELGLVHGNVMHLEMGIDQMFALRPFLGASGYRAPVRGLYLTGASTHPGGGIMGASGRNAARVLLKDLSRRRL